MEEEWKLYKTYYLCSKRHDLYVSNYGRVRDNDKIKIRKYRVGDDRIYVAVAKLFVHNPDPINKTQVDHIDTDRNNNRADNLRWVTNQENMRNEITRQHCSEAAKKRWKDGVYDNNSIKLKGREAWNKGKKGKEPWNKGKKGYKTKPCSEERKLKISKANKGRTSPMKGKKFSEEHKKKISLSKLGKHKIWNEDHTEYHFC